MTRTIDVIDHDREYAPGKHTHVRKYKRTIPDEQYDPLPDVVVEKIAADRVLPQDKGKIARITFLKGNELWTQKVNRYDVLKFDAQNVPEYDKVPEKALPNQIIRVGAKYYLGDKKGKFRRTFPPTAKKYREPKKGARTHKLEGEESEAWRKEHTAREIKKGQERRDKELVRQEDLKKKRREKEALKRKQEMQQYAYQRKAQREIKRSKTDRNLRTQPGWHTIRTTGYGNIRHPKTGGFPFAVLNEKTGHYDNYYTWPGKKERERLIEEGEIKA